MWLVAKSEGTRGLVTSAIAQRPVFRLTRAKRSFFKLDVPRLCLWTKKRLKN